MNAHPLGNTAAMPDMFGCYNNSVKFAERAYF